MSPRTPDRSWERLKKRTNLHDGQKQCPKAWPRMWNRDLINLGHPTHEHGGNEATADISNPDPAEVPALGADAVRVTGAKRVLVWSSKQAPLHASSESTELIISVHGWK